MSESCFHGITSHLKTGSNDFRTVQTVCIFAYYMLYVSREKYAKNYKAKIAYILSLKYFLSNWPYLLKFWDQKYDVRCSGGRGLCLCKFSGIIIFLPLVQTYTAEHDLHRRLQLLLTTGQNQIFFRNWFILLINSKHTCVCDITDACILLWHQNTKNFHFYLTFVTVKLLSLQFYVC